MIRELKSGERVRRDELGVKPLYWTKRNGTVWVADNANAFFEQAGVPRNLRKELLGEYFAQGWICEPDTIWEGVYKIPAGCELVVEEPIVVRRWWRPDGLGADTPVREMIRKSVERAIEGEKKVCNWFSGGIDSSIIAAFVRNKGLKHLHMTLGDGESVRVQKMEAAFALDVERLSPDPSLIRLYPELCRKMGEPIADPGIIAAYWLGLESVKRGCQAVLSGMGGDEIDAGYPRNRIIVRLFGCWAVRLLGNWILRVAGKMLWLGSLAFSGKRKRDVRRLGSFLSHPDLAHYFNLFGYFTREEINRIVGPGWFERYRGKVEELTQGYHGMKKFFAYELKGFLASHNNIYGAQACMAAGVECLTPLLDPQLVQALWTEIDSPRNVGKRRLTEVLEDELGPSFIKVRKSGFRFPVEQKLGEINWQQVKDSLRGVIRSDGLKLLDECLAVLRDGDVDAVYMKLWAFWTLAEVAGD